MVTYGYKFFHLILDILFGLWQFDLSFDLFDSVVYGARFVTDLLHSRSEKEIYSESHWKSH